MFERNGVLRRTWDGLFQNERRLLLVAGGAVLGVALIGDYASEDVSNQQKEYEHIFVEVEKDFALVAGMDISCHPITEMVVRVTSEIDVALTDQARTTARWGSAFRYTQDYKEINCKEAEAVLLQAVDGESPIGTQIKQYVEPARSRDYDAYKFGSTLYGQQVLEAVTDMIADGAHTR